MSVSAATQEIKIYGYRWVVLLTFMFISLTMQIFWICYAPITGLAAAQYGVSDLEIALLAMLFMYIYIPLAIPASWAIDTWGFKKAVGLGAILMGVFGMVRGIWTDSYTAALLGTIGIAIAQPLFLNSGTKLAANWFPLGAARHGHRAGSGSALPGHRHRADGDALPGAIDQSQHHHADLRHTGGDLRCALPALRPRPPANALRLRGARGDVGRLQARAQDPRFLAAGFHPVRGQRHFQRFVHLC